MPTQRRSTPANNYLSGTGKSLVWAGQAHYVPSERSWIGYHQYRSLPRDTKRDAIDMQCEDQWVEFQRQRDTPSGYYHKNIGLKQTGIAANNLFGYTRDLPSMPHKDTFQNPWPRSDAYVTVDRRDRGEYYGYYHEVMDQERVKRRAEFPDSMKSILWKFPS
ncbi:hypothetical protein ScPMuIL_016478 [Solemya velum]